MSRRSQILQDWLDRINPGDYLAVGSSLKFCVLAEGKADLYPRIGTTMEWDTAAGQAILEAAGGTMIDNDGKRFFYGKAGRKNARFSAMGSISTPIPAHWHAPLSDTPAT
jgi:3'(2'), 5'-bisphosphate nucleotidase